MTDTLHSAVYVLTVVVPCGMLTAYSTGLSMPAGKPGTSNRIFGWNFVNIPSSVTNYNNPASLGCKSLRLSSFTSQCSFLLFSY